MLITPPAELFAGAGLNLKPASSFGHTLVVSLCTTAPPAAACDRGGYEVTECLLAPERQGLCEEKAAEIMRRLHPGCRARRVFSSTPQCLPLPGRPRASYLASWKIL